jgi:MFS superfamily sulfate permease-like transporter
MSVSTSSKLGLILPFIGSHLVRVHQRMRSWIDLALMFVTFAFTLIWSVEVGVVVSVTASLLLVVYKSSKAHIKILVSQFAMSFALRGRN